jgi:3D-(3,5/4)-trihydroxycyclohexane-1,2-dione acylhydrolase (decyclizing)
LPRHNIPLVETQAGKGAVDWEEPLHFGSPGVTGTGCGNELAAKADLVIGVGTRFQDFTTGSWTVFRAEPQAVCRSTSTAMTRPSAARSRWSRTRRWRWRRSAPPWGHRFADPDFAARDRWFATTDGLFAAPKGNELPTDAQVIGAVQRNTGKHPDHVRRRHHARRAACAVARGAGRLSHGIRLFLHGL